MSRLLAVVPGWLIVLIVIAVLAFLGNALGLFHIHFNIGGSVTF